MTNRSVYEGTCKTAQGTAVASIAAAANTAQETISMNGSPGLGTSRANGVTAAQDVTIRAANVTLQVAIYNAQATKQATEQTAKDLLASQGDVGPR